MKKNEIIYCKAINQKVNKLYHCPDYTCSQCLKLSPPKVVKKQKATLPERKGAKRKDPSKIELFFLYDKVQALKRSQQYQKDYKDYKQRQSKNPTTQFILSSSYIEPYISEEEKRLCRKYDIPFLFVPDKDTDIIARIDSRSLSSYFGNPVTPVNPYPGLEEAPMPEAGPCFLANRYHFLLVDLKQPQKALENAFRNIVKELRGYEALKDNPKEQKKKRRPFSVDKWKVYDLYQKGMNLSRITQKLYNKKKLSPAYNEEDKRFYSRVKRAYREADNIVKAVDKHSK